MPTLKDWLPAIIGGAVGAADPQSGQALVGAMSMADAFKRRRMMDERTAAAEAKANEQFNWSREQHAAWDRDRQREEHERVLTEQARGSFDFTDWSADAIAAANAARNPNEFFNVVEAVKGREYRVAAEQRATAGEARVSETYNYNVGRRPTEEHYAETTHNLSEAAGGRAAEQYNWSREMRPFETAQAFGPLMQTFLLSASNIQKLQSQVDTTQAIAEMPPEREGAMGIKPKAPRAVTPEEAAKDPALADLQKKHELEGKLKVGDVAGDLSKEVAKAQAALAQIETLASTLPDNNPLKAQMMQQAAALRQLIPQAGPQPAGGGTPLSPEAQAVLNKYSQ